MRIRDENKAQAIRQKAIEIVVQNGLEGLSMQKLAKAAGVSPATIYIYYKDKEDLILNLGIEMSYKMLETSLKDFDPDMNFEEGLKRQWLNRAEFYVKCPMEVLFIEQIRYSPLYERVTESIKKGFGEVMGKFVHGAIARKELVPLPFEVYWSLAFAPLYQLIKFHSHGKSYVNPEFSMNEETMNLALKLVLKALRP